MTIPIPSLSAKGWVTSPVEKADIAMAHSFCADKRQSLIYGKNVASIPWLYEQYSHDIQKLMSAIQQMYQDYLGRYYTSVAVDVREDPESTLTNFTTLRLYISVTENGKDYSFGQLIDAADGKFVKVRNLINNGTTSP
jgi:hypothetical protein